MLHRVKAPVKQELEKNLKEHFQRRFAQDLSFFKEDVREKLLEKHGLDLDDILDSDAEDEKESEKQSEEDVEEADEEEDADGDTSVSECE